MNEKWMTDDEQLVVFFRDVRCRICASALILHKSAGESIDLSQAIKSGHSKDG